MKKTKIICSIGPSSTPPEIMKQRSFTEMRCSF